MVVPKLPQVRPGVLVNIVLKEDQRTGKLTTGRISDILTRGDHPRGIKVRLSGGQVGRVQSLFNSSDQSAAAQSILCAQTGLGETYEGSSVHSGGRRKERFAPQEDYRQNASPPESRSLADYIRAPTSSRTTHVASSIAVERTIQAELQRDFPKLDSALIAAILADHEDVKDASGNLHVPRYNHPILTGDLIKVFVGPKRKMYQVHKDLLTPYVNKSQELAFRSLILGITNEIDVPKTEPIIWDLFVNWLYRRNLKEISMENESEAKALSRNYIHLYLKARIWRIPDLQNLIMDRLRSRKTCELGWFPRNEIRLIYQDTPKGFPLRSYVVDSFLAKGYFWDSECENGGRAAQIKRHLDYGNQEFVLDCYEALYQAAAKSKIRDPDNRVGCVYHEHEDGRKCKP